MRRQKAELGVENDQLRHSNVEREGPASDDPIDALAVRLAQSDINAGNVDEQTRTAKAILRCFENARARLQASKRHLARACPWVCLSATGLLC